MMQEDYVNFETAKLLKEKGFDESCYQKYDCDGDLSFNYVGYINGEKPCDDFCALAPTLQMAMKWLREKHHLHVLPDIADVTQVNPKYLCAILGMVKHKSYVIDLFDSYEQACEEGIKYCLENLI
jgi:hypothetical protein